MKVINVHEAKTHLSSLLAQVESGEEIIIAKAGRPVAKLSRISPAKKKRVAGTAKSLIKIKSGFEEPLQEEVLKDFGL